MFNQQWVIPHYQSGRLFYALTHTLAIRTLIRKISINVRSCLACSIPISYYSMIDFPYLQHMEELYKSDKMMHKSVWNNRMRYLFTCTILVLYQKYFHNMEY